ncbi:MAG: GNAT family N-acetyltransferase [Acidobacteriia bacterium]|nr:GNAT family N-acetyltransferase [Methyloceanibacter sp.]MBX5473378.1 GNAT family N-acetyltransferase [Acetobacteraceae bacterium]MCL6491482.1 GNAT family N-acetyltransferase [Terriglobia bacterium]
MIVVRRARLSDAAGIAAVHVSAWRSTYPGILPDAFLSGLSVVRQAAYYEAAISAGIGVHVVTASGLDVPARPPSIAAPARVVGFVTADSARGSGSGLADGEIETLYVLDDWRERGLGRRLMRTAAGHLAGMGCRSALVWVLRDNPSRWFYQRLGGRPMAESTLRFAGVNLIQLAFVWDPIERLLQASAQAS